MAEPSSNSAFSAFLKAANRRSSATQQSGDRAPEASGATVQDQKHIILAALADGQRSIAEVSQATGIPLTALIEAVRPLEEFRLIRRIEKDDELAFELTRGGYAVLQPAKP
jgi:hypothetical protein